MANNTIPNDNSNPMANNTNNDTTSSTNPVTNSPNTPTPSLNPGNEDSSKGDDDSILDDIESLPVPAIASVGAIILILIIVVTILLIVCCKVKRTSKHGMYLISTFLLHYITVDTFICFLFIPDETVYPSNVYVFTNKKDWN